MISARSLHASLSPASLPMLIEACAPCSKECTHDKLMMQKETRAKASMRMWGKKKKKKRGGRRGGGGF